jgi:hypothetical protein
MAKDNMLGLVKYDAACRALAEAKAVDEAKHIRGIAEMMRAYAKQAKNKQLEVDAAEIRFRAERRVGELMQAQRETVGLAKGTLRRGSDMDPREDKPTLAEAGIDKHLADRARKMAAVPRDEFEAEVSGWRERVSHETARVTTNLLARGEQELEREDEFEDDIEPEHYEGAFLMRADTAIRMAVYARGPVTNDVVLYARRAASAWTKLADSLQTQFKEKSQK